MEAEIGEHIAASAVHFLLGFSSAVVAGFPFGVLLFLGRLKPLVWLFDFLRAIPAIALFPVFIYALGIGTAAKAAIIFWTSFPVFALGVYSAISAVDSDVTDAAQIDGLAYAPAVFIVSIPAAWDEIIIAARAAVGSAMISIVAAEMLGSSAGLGFFIMSSSQVFNFRAVTLGIITLGLVGLALNILLSKGKEYEKVFRFVRGFVLPDVMYCAETDREYTCYPLR